MPSGNWENFASFFMIMMPVVFCWLITLARPSRTRLERSSKGRYPCHVPDFRGKVCSFIPLRLMLANAFFEFIEMILWYLSFFPVNGVKVKVSQSCPTLCDPTDYEVNGIFQARILEWVVFPFCRGSSQPRDRTQVSCIAGGFFTSWATREVLMWYITSIDFLMLNHHCISRVNTT